MLKKGILLLSLSLLAAAATTQTVFAFVPLIESKRMICVDTKNTCLHLAQDTIYSSPKGHLEKSMPAFGRPEFSDGSVVFSPDTMAPFYGNVLFVSKNRNLYLLSHSDGKYIQLAVQNNKFKDDVVKLFVLGFNLYAITSTGTLFEGVFPPTGEIDYNTIQVNTRDGEESKQTFVYQQARDLFSELSHYSKVKSLVQEGKAGQIKVVLTNGKKEALVGK